MGFNSGFKGLTEDDWSKRIACWILKATNTLSEYVILIAFPLHQWLHERSAVFVIRTLLVLLWPRWRVFTARYEMSP